VKGDRLLPSTSLAALIDSSASRFWRYSSAELRCLSKEVMHGLLSSRSLSIENEDSLLDILIEIDSEDFEYWSRIEVSCLSSDGLSRYAEHLAFDQVTTDIWTKLSLHLRGVSSADDLRVRHHNSGLPCESSILGQNRAPLPQFANKKWRRLYRGSQDGFRASDFHRKCDGCANTVTLVLTTKGYVFGGFTSVPWESGRGDYMTDRTPESFIFSVKDPSGACPRVFPIIAKSYAIYCRDTYGPTFGGGHDIHIADNCQENMSSYTNLGKWYGNYTDRNGTQVLAGEKNFKVKEIEVFAVTL
jgi:hypothetical protein